MTVSVQVLLASVPEYGQRALRITALGLSGPGWYLKVRQNHRVVNLALVIAVGVDEVGERYLLGFDLGGSEEQAFWLAFLRSLVQRGKAPQQVFTGASWQRCVGNAVSPCTFMRNLLAKIPHRDKAAVDAAARLIFDQPSLPSAGIQLRQLVAKLGRACRTQSGCWRKRSPIF